MKSIKIIRLLIKLLIILLYSYATLANDTNSNVEKRLMPEEIQKDISNRGAREVSIDLYSNKNVWSFILKKISSGEPKWLQVAVDLKPGTDAAASEMLTFAVGEALEYYPGNVFQIVLKNYDLKSICDAPDIDDSRYDSYELALNAINRRKQRVIELESTSPNIKEQCKKCITYLERSKDEVSKFYGGEVGPR